MTQSSDIPKNSIDHERRWHALWALCGGVLMSTLDLNIVNVALPTLAQEMRADLALVQWVIIIYGMVVTGFMLSMGSLGDLLGKRRVFVCGLWLFTIGSLACALSLNIYMLIAARAFQGLGAVMMQALIAAVIVDTFPAGERGRALGAMGAVVSVGLALGPAIGGILLGFASWHVIFLVNVPLGIATLIAVYRYVPDMPATDPSHRLNLVGTAFLFTTIACYALGMTIMQTLGPYHIRVLLLLVTATASATAFAWSEYRSDHPMFNPALFKDKHLMLGLVMSFMTFLLLGATFLLPFYLQYGRGYSPTVMGFLLMVAPVTMGLVAPIAGICSDRWGTGGIRMAGLLLLAGGCLLVSNLSPDASLLEFVVKYAPCGLGMGLFQSPNLSAVMNKAPSGQSGAVSAAISLTRTLGTTTGLPLMGMVFMAHMSMEQGGLGRETMMLASPVKLADSLAGTFTVAAFIALAGAGLAGWAWLKPAPRQTSQENRPQ